MFSRRVQTFCLGIAVVLATSGYASAVNSFLAASDDREIAAKFSGSGWGDEMEGDVPLSATVVTRRVAQMSWGAVFEIRFDAIRSRSKPPREIRPLYYVATDDRIYLLNETNNLEAAERLAQLATAPNFEDSSVYGISAKSFTHSDPPWETKITVEGDTCRYSSTHNSGHFTTVVWKRGVGLIEYAMGSGARADGFRLRRLAQR